MATHSDTSIISVTKYSPDMVGVKLGLNQIPDLLLFFFNSEIVGFEKDQGNSLFFNSNRISAHRRWGIINRKTGKTRFDESFDIINPAGVGKYLPNDEFLKILYSTICRTIINLAGTIVKTRFHTTD
jgi:hypothetical protein